jgi:hypothetical protein
MSSVPHYVLVSNASPPSLTHPSIQYIYADDSPVVLLPRSPNEHVILIEYNPNTSNETITTSQLANISVKSLSSKVAVTGIKTVEEGGETIYIVDTTSPTKSQLISTSSMLEPSPNAQTNLDVFKKRNKMLREAIAYSQPQTRTADRPTTN